MTITKSGNIAIKINPERWHAGQFVGKKFYRAEDIKKAFGAIDINSVVSGTVQLAKYDPTSNEKMIDYYCTPFRRIGFIVQ